MFLNNYTLSCSDIASSIVTGFTGAPYAKRHWDAASKASDNAIIWGHRTIALLEAVPVLGMIVALVDRLAHRLWNSYDDKPSLKQKQAYSFNNQDSTGEVIKLGEVSAFLNDPAITVSTNEHGSTVSCEINFED